MAQDLHWRRLHLSIELLEVAMEQGSRMKSRKLLIRLTFDCGGLSKSLSLRGSSFSCRVLETDYFRAPPLGIEGGNRERLPQARPLWREDMESV